MSRQPDILTPEPAPVPKARNRFARMLFWLRALFVVCLLPLVFAAAAAVMMIDREITAPSWIKNRVEQRADTLLEGSYLEFGEITVRIARDLHPTVRLVDTQLFDADGALVARIPIVEGLMSPRGLIFQQDVLMQQVRLRGAQINLRRAKSGEVSFALIQGGYDLQQARSLPELLDRLDVIFERPAFDALEVVQADGLIVNFDDARAGRSWIIDGGAAMLDLRGGQTEISGEFTLLSGRADVSVLDLSYVSPRGSRAAQVAMNITNAVASDIATQSPALGWLRDVDAPMTANLRTTLDDDGKLGVLNAALEIEQGVFQPNPAAEQVTFDAAKAYFTYDPVRDLISFSEVSMVSAWGQLTASGDAYLREFRDGLPRALLAQFRFSDVAISPPGLFETPPQVDEVSIDLRARFDPFVVEIGQVVAIDGDSHVTGRGRIAATDAGWSIAVDTQIDQIRPERVVGFWPLGVKPRTRAWVAGNLADGQLFNVNFGLRKRPQEALQLGAGFEFSDMTIKALRSLPPIKGARGTASIADNQLIVSVDDGAVSAPQGGPVHLAGSSFSVVDLTKNPSPSVLELRTDSTLTAGLSILNQPPFSYMDKANLPVTLGDGRAVVQGRITWPLMPRPPAEEILFDVTAALQNVRSDTLVQGKQFVAPQLQVTASRAGINIAGPVQIGAARAIGAWDQRFGDPDLPGSRVLAQVDLSQAFLDEFGIALPDGMVSGSGKGELAISFQSGAAPAFSVNSDLVGLRMAVPAVGWVKDANTAGRLQIDGALGAVPSIDRIALSGAGLRAQGRVDLDDTGGFSAARLSSLQVGDWLNAPVTLTGRGPGQAVGVQIEGGTLDLRGAQFGGGGGQSASGAPISIALDRLQVSEGIAIDDFRGDFRSETGFRGEFQGQLNGLATVQGAVAPRNGRSAVRVRSDNAGRVLRAAGLTDNARGGSFDMTLLPAVEAGTFDGILDIRDIRLQDAPAMAAILDAISVVGLLQQLDGQGLAFDELDAAFRLTPSQVIISEASAVGPGLGISIDGIYMLASKQLDLQGVVSPFYLVNSIGSFLTRKGEGLIGFSYTVLGTTDAPQVSVNPLSAFTPGMFREIFRRPAPDISQ